MKQKMELFEAVARRRSIRRFLPDPVRPEHLRAMLEAANLAPSTHNAQPWHFVVIRDASLRDALRDAVSAVIDSACARADAATAADYQQQKFFATSVFGAPVTVATLTHPVGSPAAGTSPLLASGLLSTAAAVAQFNLAAVALGYGCCWSTLALSWARTPIEEILQVEPPQTVAVLLSVGVPAKTPREIVRKPVEEVVTFK